MVPTWLTVLAWTSLAVAFVCAGMIAVEIFVKGYRQHVWIMGTVWPLTALYSGPLGWLAYRRWGRLNSPRYRQETGDRHHYPFSVSVGISDTHCGAGCALGDLIAEWVLFAVGGRSQVSRCGPSTSLTSRWRSYSGSPSSTSRSR
jgi:hypothetical protein